MHSSRKILIAYCVVLVVAALFALVALAVAGLRFTVIPLALVACCFYLWALAAFFYYRYARQEEVLHLLTTAAEMNAPLAPALLVYLKDRHSGDNHEFWVACALFFLLPGYYWIWHRYNNFDQKVGRLAYRLMAGDPLSRALQDVPGVVPRETALAASVGQATGRLGLCLRQVSSGRIAVLWLEIIPRLIYPLGVILFMVGLAAFFNDFIGPRFQRIFSDFHIPLPMSTTRLMEGGPVFADFFEEPSFQDFLGNPTFLLPTVLLGSLVILGLLLISGTIRWYCPFFGTLYRLHVRGRLLKMLAVLIEAELPAPQALHLLASSNCFRGFTRRRLLAAQRQVQGGRALSESLYRTGLLTRAVSPLVQSAERRHSLAHTLGELGEILSQRMLTLTRRTSLALFSAMTAFLGVIVAFMALGMFLPLIRLIEGVAK